MACYREETWGRVEYDPTLDEFEAAVCGDTDSVLINQPISTGCLVTGRCNLHCEFCYGNDEALPKSELTWQEWSVIFKHMRTWGLMRVDLSGGEPTIREDIPLIAQAATDAGLNVILSTNGMLAHKTGPVRFPSDVRFHVSMDSGFSEIHESSRILRNYKASRGSLDKAFEFLSRTVDAGYRTRVLTCIGRHNWHGLFELAERIALVGVPEWNISRILRAGRAQNSYEEQWKIEDEEVYKQIHLIRRAFPWMRIRYSNRTEQDGYFLLVLPDGTLATQYTDHRDKVTLGKVLLISLEDIQSDPKFDLRQHGRKWIAAVKQCERFLCPACQKNSNFIPARVSAAAETDLIGTI